MRNRILLLTMALALGALALPTNANPVDINLDGEKPYEFDRWIVGFHEETGLDVGDTFVGAPVVAVDRDLRFIVVRTAHPAALEAAALLDPNVRYVEWDNPLYATIHFTPNDTYYTHSGHYGTKISMAHVAWDKTRGTTAVKVGVLDTGIKKTHEEFYGSGRVLQGYDFYNNDNDPNEISACGYHGSHVSGTIGATINNAKGIAGLAQTYILPVRAFGGSSCGGSTTALVNGLKYIANQGSHLSSNSWGSSVGSTALNDALAYAASKGTIHVAAAGNSGPCSNCVSYPWRSNDARTIIVTAVDSSKNQASFSSDGPQTDLAAAGVSVLSVNGGSTTGYKQMSGTSMACPHVTGIAALVKTLNPSFGFSSMEGRLKSTAEDRGTAGEDDLYGAGLVRADRAVY